MIAVALAPLGAIVVLNASAYTSYPAEQLPPRLGETLEEVLRTLPLMALFVGFVKLYRHKLLSRFAPDEA